MTYLIEPWEHQKRAVARSKWVRDFCLFWEMGAGKTKGAIEIVRDKCRQEGRELRVMVFGPPVVVPNWCREFSVHSKLRSHALTGPVKKRTEALKKVNSGVVVTPYTSLLGVDFERAAIAWKPDIIIFDEIHRLKSVKAKTHKAAFRLAKVAQHRYGLTGTPVLNTPMDVFGIFRVTDLGETFGDNFFTFRAQYFVDRNVNMPRHRHFPDWQPRPDTSERIRELIEKKAMYVKKEDCLDLPPLVKQKVEVELSPQQKKIYREMRNDFLAFVEGKRGETKAAVASIALTKALRMMQIVTGFVTVEGDDDERETHTIEGKNPRADALHDILEEVGATSKVIVWSVFKQNYKEIRKVCDKLGLGYVELHGSVPAAKRQPNIDAFNDDPSVRVLIGHPGSGGIGVNLVSSDYAVFYSRNFSLENDLQAEARNHRGGSEIHKKVTRVDIVTPGTIDELVMERLAQKVSVSDAILMEIAEEL